MPVNAPDLTKRPPRSPRVRLGGYVILPRMLDKGRATLAGTNGEFNYNCPLDQHFVRFAGIDADALKNELAKGSGDAEILDWIAATSTTKPTLTYILAWSAFQEQRSPGDLDTRKFFNEYHAKMAPHRTDIATWFDLLDVDDFVSFGGKA
jgi:hypothetical protein